MGELFNSPHEWQPLITEQLIDCFAGGRLQPSAQARHARRAVRRKDRVAWGHMANVTLDSVRYNFGIQEYSSFNERTRAIFQGCPEMRDGYLWVSEKPGWGIEIDEKEAAKGAIHCEPDKRRLGRNPPARRHRDQPITPEKEQKMHCATMAAGETQEQHGAVQWTFDPSSEGSVLPTSM
jgi:hypothetical protein